MLEKIALTSAVFLLLFALAPKLLPKNPPEFVMIFSVLGFYISFGATFMCVLLAIWK